MRTLMLTLALAPWVTTHAGADELETPDLALSYEAYQTMSERDRLEDEYEAIRLTGPSVGLTISTAALVAAPFPIAFGSLDNLFDVERSSGGKAALAGGTVMAFGGLVGMIVSAALVSQRRRARKEIRQQLATLDRP